MDSINRRDFFAAVPAIVAGTALAAAPVNHETIIDTHTHFYDPTRPQGVPWPGKDDKLLYRRVLPATYKTLAQPLGVTGAVVVEASPWVEDNQWLLDLAKDEPFLVGVVGRLTPGDADFAGRLKRFAANLLFRGIRISTDELKPGLDRPRFLADLKRLVDHDLELDVNGNPDTPAAVAELAKALPDLRIVIDHAANVPIDGRAVPAGWLAGMKSAANRPRVFCKVSALAESTGRADGKAPKDVSVYQPVLDALWNVFGEDRLIYGSNWPVSERYAPYAAVQGIVADFFRAKGKTATEKFFWRNSLAAYKWIKR